MAIVMARVPRSNSIGLLVVVCCLGVWLESVTFVGVAVGLDEVLLGVGLGVGCVGLGVRSGVDEGCLSFMIVPGLMFVQTSVSVGGA